ncbi:hypothetical protein BJ170DRAFT_593374 [Xylariales sp. AK1849]|nr:hypothetical protein BJ170DRAFT_593374 [Xylariales sp. AK1849]
MDSLRIIKPSEHRIEVPPMGIADCLKLKLTPFVNCRRPECSDCNIGKITFVNAGTYMLKGTVTIPSGTKLVGETWSQFAASGAYFSDASAPKVMLQVGLVGSTGDVEIQDLIFTTKGQTPGAILAQWNILASSQGSAGFDPLLDDAANSMEMISLYVGHGILIESDTATWLYGTASEHSVYYQYNFNGAKNIFAGFVQTESPYYQPTPEPPQCSYDDPSCNPDFWNNRGSWQPTFTNGDPDEGPDEQNPKDEGVYCPFTSSTSMTIIQPTPDPTVKEPVAQPSPLENTLSCYNSGAKADHVQADNAIHSFCGQLEEVGVLGSGFYYEFGAPSDVYNS